MEFVLDRAHTPAAIAGGAACDAAPLARMRAALTQQRRSFIDHGSPSAELRLDRIGRATALLVEHRRELCDALAADHGVRPASPALALDLDTAIASLEHARRHLRRWMRPRDPAPAFALGWRGRRARFRPQPVGVVGAIAPRDFPICHAFGPLAAILAAGNRCMMQLCEFVPRLSGALARRVGEAFDPAELVAFQGGAEPGVGFATLPFDHLFCTGHAAAGRQVLHAAAESLTPVTLALGGKSPVVVGASARLAYAARRIAWAKLLHGGQFRLAPDYVLMPEWRASSFIAAYQAAVAALYPALAANPDYPPMDDAAQRARVQSWLDDAHRRGVRVIAVNPGGEDFVAARKPMPALLLDPGDDCLVMQHEILGPLLPIRTYRSIDEAIACVNSRPRAPALYYFGSDRAESARVLASTHAGGAWVNDLFAPPMPGSPAFGRCGGHAVLGDGHGEQGFRTFSRDQWVASAGLGAVDPPFFMHPPRGRALQRALAWLVRN